MQPGHQLLAELLLACASGPNLGLAHLDEASKPACANDSFISQAITHGWSWSFLVAAAPAQIREAVVSRLLLQATCEAAAATAAGSNSSSAVARAAASSSNGSSSSKPGSEAHMQRRRWCWGFHVNASNQLPGSQAPSTAAAAGAPVSLVTEQLQVLSLHYDKSLQLPLHVLKKQHTQQLLLAAFNNAGGDAAHNMQQQQLDKVDVKELVLLLYHHWPLQSQSSSMRMKSTQQQSSSSSSSI
jgi:hypothetical protein